MGFIHVLSHELNQLLVLLQVLAHLRTLAVEVVQDAAVAGRLLPLFFLLLLQEFYLGKQHLILL